MSSVLFSSDIKDASDLPIHLNYDIENLIKYISDINKKYLLLSLLKINIKILLYDESNKNRKEINKDINFLINIFLRSYHDSMNIYPKNLNIIHFIIFNKININEVLYLLIKIYYMKPCRIIQHDYPTNNIEYLQIYKKASYRFSNIHNSDTNKLLNNIRESYDNTNINILFNHNYTDLLFNGPNISNEISILTDKINNLQIQTDYYYKLNEECNFNKQKIINDINHINHQLNIYYNENKKNKNEIMNEIYILIDKINKDIVLIKNEIINDVNQLNIQNNNKLINEITLLTTKINDSQTQNNYYYNKIKILESKTYILNRILLIIIIIYFLIIFIIGTLFMFLIFNYDNIIDKEVLIYYYKKYIYIDNNSIVKLQLLN